MLLKIDKSVKSITRMFINLIIIFSLTLLNACANFLPETINISQEKIQTKLTQKFPKNKNILSLYQVTLTNPQLSLDQSTNRVKISLDAQINSSIMKTIQGKIQFSSGLILDDKKENLLLKEPTVDDFSLKDDSQYSVNNILLPVLKVSISDILDLYPIYKIKPEELTFLGMHFEPVGINVKSNSIDIKIQKKHN